MKDSRGFTLPEVLITLAIVGIVAALVIPIVVTSINDQALRTAWKKNYAIINEAFKRVTADNGGSLNGICTSSGYDTSENCLRNELVKYISYISTYDALSTLLNDSGYTWEYYDLSKWNHSAVFNSGALLVLNNGALVKITYLPGSPWGNFVYSNQGPIVGKTYGYFAVDVNGTQKPNQIGRDLFYIHITEKGLYPWGTQGDNFDTTRTGPWGKGCDLTADIHASGYTCASDLLLQ